MNFQEWERDLTSTPDYPNNNEARLAFQTLNVCINESPIAKDEISQNGYALFDFVMFCYFIFRASLCSAFSNNFVELYDTYTQHLMSQYFQDFFCIPKTTIGELIVMRANKYESLTHADNVMYEITATLTQYIQKDLSGMPEYEGILLTGFDQNIELHLKLHKYIQPTFAALEKQRAFILLCESKKTYAYNTTTPSPANQNRAQPVIEKKESQVKQEEPKTAIQTSKKNNGIPLKEKLTNTLGAFGLVLYYIFALFISALPFVMIGGNFFVTAILTAVNFFFPPSSVIFWIWGLVCASKGPQDFIAIIYYIVFIIVWLPYYLSLILSLFLKDNH